MVSPWVWVCAPVTGHMEKVRGQIARVGSPVSPKEQT